MPEAFQPRICKGCGREFRPSSRHKKCPKCRHPDQQIECACGRMMKRESVQCVECRDLSMESNGNWRGGRTRHSAGYLMRRVPDHPRGRNNGGYVFDHVVVMEEKLGRFLLPGETVHHLNGLRDDNRPENLELWTRPQPSGIRAVDAVEWAMEIIARYGQLHPKRPIVDLAGNDPASHS